MEILDELRQAVNSIIEIANRINDETSSEIFDKAPVIIHQRLCSELVNIAKKHPNKLITKRKDAGDILIAINVLKQFYPELNKI